MRIRIGIVFTLACFLFLSACAARDASGPVTARFPDRPADVLAKTPEQSLAGNTLRQGVFLAGGWGYKPADAFLLTVQPGQRRKYHNTIPLENMVVRTRNDLEFFDTPPQGQRYVVVDYGPVSRTVSTREGKMFAVWRADMYLVSENASPTLFLEAANRPLNRRATPETRAVARAVPREYWFNITDTFTPRSRRLPSARAAPFRKADQVVEQVQNGFTESALTKVGGTESGKTP